MSRVYNRSVRSPAKERSGETDDPSEGGKPRDGTATNHSSRFLFVFFFLPPSPLLFLFVLEEWKNEKGSRERERGEMKEDNSLESHRDQHFSIRRIIHFFSPSSIGRSLFSLLLFPLFLSIAVGCFFFSSSSAACRTLVVCWWAAFRSIDQFEGDKEVDASVRNR